MAQSPKNGSARRSVSVRVRVTVAERKQVEQFAANAGLTISDWIRAKIVGAKPLLRKPSPDREVLLRLLASHGKVGSLLNQIARQLNRKQDTENVALPVESVMYIIEQVKTVTIQIRERLDHGSHQVKD